MSNLGLELVESRKVPEIVRAVGPLPPIFTTPGVWYGVVPPEALGKRPALELDDVGTLAAFEYSGREAGIMGITGQNPSYLLLHHAGADLQELIPPDTADFMLNFFNLVANAGYDHVLSQGANGRVIRQGSLVGAHLPLKASPTPPKFLDLVTRVGKHDGVTPMGFFDVSLYGVNGMRYSTH